MPDIGEIGVPLGYTGLGEAYEQAWRALHDAPALVASAGPWKQGSRSWKWALAKRRRMHAKALVEGRPDYPGLLDPEGERAYDAARGDVEWRMRTAIARGELDAFYRDPRTVEVLRGLDRESWTGRMSPPGFGLSNDIHNATCPGPAHLEGRLVFLDALEFRAWLRREIRLRQAAERQAQSALAEALAAKAEAQVTAEIERRGGFMPQDEGAEFMRQHAPNYPRARARKFVASLTGNARRGPRGPRSSIKK
jgi:hypothetical protein